MYPNIRMRRLRNDPLVRAMVTEVTLSPSNFILPVFAKESLVGNEKHEVQSMPGIFQHSIGSVLEECQHVIDLGIPGIILFVAAAIVSSSRKSRAASLRAQLESIKHKTTESLGREQPLEILKKQFVEGKIDKKTYLEKKQVLEK